MARERDEAKRAAILAAAKRLFAERGYKGVSVSALAREARLPIGSIYTYFDSKEAIVTAIVEEGWDRFIASIEASLLGGGSPSERFAVLVYGFLPKLLADVDIISILLTEAGRSFRLEDKLERLAALVSGLVGEMAASRGVAVELTPKRAKAAVMIHFLGSLDAVRLGKSAGVDVGPEDVIDFFKSSIEMHFGIVLPSPRGGVGC